MSDATAPSDALSLSEAAKAIPGRPHVSTLWRWATRGVRGVRLRTFVIGGRRFTDVAAIEEFIRRTTAASAIRCSDETSSPNCASANLRDAEAYCRSQGF